MSTTTPRWVRTLQITYLATLGVWIAATVFVVFAELQGSYGPAWFGLSGTAIMIGFGAGPIYLTIQSMRLGKQEAEERNRTAQRIFAIQQVVGVPLLVGAILGGLPAAVNIGSFFIGMTPADQIGNAGSIIPWAMVYVYTATYLVVVSVRRGLRTAPADAREDDTTPTTGQPVEFTEVPKNEPRRPIAPNLFFVGAVLLGLFTFMVELQAWGIARNGDFSQLDMSGPVTSFGLTGFLDATLGNFAAVVIIIFGLINWSRDTERFRRIATPLLAVICLIITPGSVARALVGVVGLSNQASERNENAQIGSEWINAINAEGMPEGFSDISTFLDCGVENCLEDPDSEITYAQLGGYESIADSVCVSSLEFATSHGATDYAVNPDYEPVPYSEADAQAACVATLTTPDVLKFAVQTWSPTFRLSGVADGVPFVMDLYEYRFGTQSMDPGRINYFLTIRTTLQPDELLPGQDQLSAGSHELDDLLTAIGQARLGNPDTDPNDGDLIRSALATYPHDIPVRPITEPDGSIRFIELETSDGEGVMCVSIAPWDEQREGIPDPGSGYGVGSAETIQQLKDYPAFGVQAWGSCTE